MTQPAPTPPISVPPPAPAGVAPTQPPPTPDEPLREPGLRALQAEREAREALEKELAPLKELAKALAGGKAPAGKSEIDLINERLAAQDELITKQAQQIMRDDVARNKGLNAEQAAELRGNTHDELVAHADRLLTLFGQAVGGTTPPVRPGPKPDPAQGARPGAVPTGRDAGLAEAQKRFGKPAST
jgi:hypothetical protein